MELKFCVRTQIQVTSRQDSNVPKGSWIVNRLKALRGWLPGGQRNYNLRGKLITIDYDVTSMKMLNYVLKERVCYKRREGEYPTLIIACTNTLR